MTRKHTYDFFRRHSLSIVSGVILLTWIVLYSRFDPQTHWGAFFGNAIADWTGLLVVVLATKYMYEIGSAESRKPKAATPFVWARFGETPRPFSQHLSAGDGDRLGHSLCPFQDQFKMGPSGR